MRLPSMPDQLISDTTSFRTMQPRYSFPQRSPVQTKGRFSARAKFTGGRLPVELYDSIFQCVSLCHRHDLTRLALVSHDFLHLARRRLYSSVCVSDETAARFITCICAGLFNLGDHIRSLNITINYYDGIVYQVLPVVLARFPNLKKLRIVGSTFLEWSIDLLSDYPFQLDEFHTNSRLTQAIVDFLSSQASIEKCSIVTDAFKPERDLEVPDKLLANTGHLWATSSFIQWQAVVNLMSLTHLHVDFELWLSREELSGTVQALRILGPRLESLSVRRQLNLCEAWEMADVVKTVEFMPNLRYLNILDSREDFLSRDRFGPRHAERLRLLPSNASNTGSKLRTIVYKPSATWAEKVTDDDMRQISVFDAAPDHIFSLKEVQYSCCANGQFDIECQIVGIDRLEHCSHLARRMLHTFSGCERFVVCPFGGNYWVGFERLDGGNGVDGQGQMRMIRVLDLEQWISNDEEAKF